METLHCDIYCGNCRDTGNYLRSSLSFRNNSDILNIIFFLPNTPFKTLVVFDFFINTLYLTGIPSPFSRFFTSKNTIILPNFLVWKFCGKAQFPHSSGRIAFPGNQLKLRYFCIVVCLVPTLHLPQTRENKIEKKTTRSDHQQLMPIFYLSVYMYQQCEYCIIVPQLCYLC